MLKMCKLTGVCCPHRGPRKGVGQNFTCLVSKCILTGEKGQQMGGKKAQGVKK